MKISTMNSNHFIKYIFGFVLTCLLLAGVPATSLAGSGGHLIINRSANFGARVYLVISIDGREVARLGKGRSYDGYVSAGHHVISAAISPNRDDVTPAHETINAQDGHVYSYAAGWHGTTHLVLTKR
jgi:hypothetical protein